MSRILSIFLFISYNFEEWMEDFIFRNTFKWLILSYSFKELNNLLFKATIRVGIYTQLKMIYIFSIVIDYYYSFLSVYQFLNKLMSSIKNILIYSLYMKSSLQHTLFDLLSSEPYSKTNSLSIKKELIFSIIKILPLEI